MSTVRSAIERTVSISSFNRGLAGKIFSDVRRTGAKVVMKNNAAECVLMSPQEYIQLMDEVNDARLLTLATDRMKHYNPSLSIPQEQIDREFGFIEEDLLDADEVELE